MRSHKSTLSKAVTHLSHHFVPPVMGYEGRTPLHSIKTQKDYYIACTGTMELQSKLCSNPQTKQKERLKFILIGLLSSYTVRKKMWRRIPFRNLQ